MSDLLTDEAWLAPGRAGPDRRILVAALLVPLLTLGVWWLAAHRQIARSGASAACVTHAFQVGEQGKLTGGKGVRIGARTVETRAAHGFWVTDASATADPGRARCAVATVDVGGDIDAASVTVRAYGRADIARTTRTKVGEPTVRVELHGPSDRIDYLVSVAGAPEPKSGAARTAGPRSQRFDARRTQDQESTARVHRSLDRWWLALIASIAGSCAGLLLWRRAARRFRSMRRPGPGTETPTAPPSSLDPVGAAVLVAGAGPVDERAAFAAHVLDLIDRKQLRLRRDEAGGGVLGVFPVDEHALTATEDPAIAVLRAASTASDGAIALSDFGTSPSTITADQWATWRAHIAGRVRFERVVECPVQLKRLAMATGTLAAIALIATIGAFATEAWGVRIARLLIAATLLPVSLPLIAWLLDARRWRRVSRGRRLERAQWIAWRAAAGASTGTLDRRNIPILVATGDADALIPATASPGAVGSAAVTVGAVRALRGLSTQPGASTGA